MKHSFIFIFFLAVIHCRATTIDPTNNYAYGANLGWLNAYDTVNGAVIGNNYCTGYIYGGNIGWISLGNGSPANGIQYQNNSATDFGINQDGFGNLTGQAWSANVGWITFEQTYGRPKVNLLTGQLSGYIWSANCGWISLSNAFAFIETDSLWPGPLAPNGLPIPWLLIYFGITNVNPNADPTGKGMTIAQDYLAGTDPNDLSSVLRIAAGSFGQGGTNVILTWNSVPTRFYYVQKSRNLSSNNWADSGLGQVAPAAGSTSTVHFADTNAPARFYRVEAVLPLSP